MVKTDNVYEASFYLMYGAKLKDIQVRKVQENKVDKKGYRKQCTIYLDNVPGWCKLAWLSNYIYGELKTYVSIREKLKRQMRKKIYEKHNDRN